jgi:hypothetical protein
MKTEETGEEEKSQTHNVMTVCILFKGNGKKRYCNVSQI